MYVYNRKAITFYLNLYKMAYITTKEVAEIRNEIKAAFPKTFKFSVTREHLQVVKVSLMESPLNFDKTEYYQHPKGHKTILNIIKTIVNKNNFDDSDSMTDYHHVGFYSHVWVGKWDKPYKKICVS